nr:hypothetical protein [Tanacetum cinerariifolium]
MTQDPLFSSSSKDSPGVRFKPLGDEEKKDAKDSGNKDSEVPSTEEPRVNQEKDANVNSPTNNADGIKDNVVDENIVYGFSHVPTTRIYKDHPLNQVIGDLQSATQTRQMTHNLEEYRFVSTTLKQRTSHKDLQNCLFACFLSQKEPKMVVQALKDPSWIEAMHEELLQFKLQKVWTLVELPNRKRAIGTTWVFRNKKDERGIVIKNKARLVAQGYTQEKGINYDEVFAPVSRIEAIRLFLAYASFKDFVVYQMDVKSAFLYGKIEKEVYVCQPPGFEDPDFPNRVYKVKKALYGLHQAPELVQVYDEYISFGSIRKEMCTEFEKMMHKKFKMSFIGELAFFLGLLVKQKEDGIFISQDKYVNEILNKFGFSNVKTASTPMETHKTLLKDENVEDTVVANSTTKAEYVAASSCCGQVLWIQNQLLNYGDSNEKKLIQMIKIHTDKNVADLLTKAFVLKGVKRRRVRRYIADIDADKEITLVDEIVEDQRRFDDQEMFDIWVLDDEEVVVEKAVANKETSRPKAKGIVMHEPSETPTPTLIISSQQPSKVQDKGKGKAKLIEGPVKLKKKDQILSDEEVARKLQEEIYEQEDL